MVSFRTILVASTVVVTATLPLTATSLPTWKPNTGTVRSDEISGQRYNERRPVRSYNAPAYSDAPRYYRGSADPSIGPDGRPYRVPEYLRNQCYVDDGYGRFSACSNR
ncbi:hypothetical protein [Pseudorhodoplanes sinuspersici]|nr:hypothetical protein [Pseudorhodoplanes sinuspersici]RKE72276.1 hypothetical protein DFP91_0138 [Pseudorhodoplanes sinuspersici]